GVTPKNTERSRAVNTATTGPDGGTTSHAAHRGGSGVGRCHGRGGCRVGGRRSSTLRTPCRRRTGRAGAGPRAGARRGSRPDADAESAGGPPADPPGIRAGG